MAETVQLDDQGEWVSYLRRRLAYVTGNSRIVDDADDLEVFDDNLKSAVRAYQDDRGLDATGICDDETWEQLEQDGPGGGSDEDDAPEDPEGEVSPGGASDDGSGGDIFDLLGLTYVDLDFVADPEVKADQLRYVVKNTGSSEATSWTMRWDVYNNGDWVCGNESAMSDNIPAGDDFGAGIMVADLNFQLHPDMKELEEFEVYTIEVTIEPGLEWEKKRSTDFRVRVAEGAPSKPAGDDGDDDDYEDVGGLKEIVSFEPA